MKQVNRFKQYFLFQVAAIWALFKPNTTQFILDAYRFKVDHDRAKEADKDL